MNGPRIGSLFSGYGGLDLGIQAVIGGEVAWHVEFNDAPSKILAHHWPGIPNYGDITAVDWATVPPVDVLTGGFPCQDLSLAGRRAGMRDGTRSGLWADYLKAIGTLRPGLVVIENVRGLLSGCAESNLEPCPGCVGDGEHRPVLRALGRVLGDLADIGYDAEWVGLRAADAGAPHGRYRVFILAHPYGVRWGEGWPESAGRLGRLASVVGGSPAGLVADASSGGCDGWSQVEVGFPLERTVPTGVGAHTLADTRGERFGEYPGEPSAEETGPGSGDLADGTRGRRPDTDWGPYAPAITRWEQTTGRLAPAPTDQDWEAWSSRRAAILNRRRTTRMPVGMRGTLRAATTPPSHRLSSRFVEWMMGLPAGHVTDPAIGLARNQQLKALGNGVVPAQAALALSHLLNRKETA